MMKSQAQKTGSTSSATARPQRSVERRKSNSIRSGKASSESTEPSHQFNDGNGIASLQALANESSQVQKLNQLGSLTDSTGKEIGESFGEEVVQDKPLQRNSEVHDSEPSTKSTELRTESVSSNAASATVQGASAESGRSTANEATSTMPQQVGSADEYITLFESSSPVEFIGALRQAKSVVPAMQQAEAKELGESIPKVWQPTGLPTVENAGKVDSTAPVWSSPEPLVLATEGDISQSLEPPLQEQPTRSSFDAIRTPSPPAEVSREYGANVRASVNNLPTSDNVNTFAGHRPVVELDGAADANQIENAVVASDQSVNEQAKLAKSARAQTFGESNIYPTLATGMLSSNVPVSADAGGPAVDIAEIPQTSPEILQHFNADAQSMLSAGLTPEMARYQNARQTMLVESQNERANGLAKIDAETQQIRGQQQALQVGAKAKVKGFRDQWQQEDKTVRDDFETQSGDSRQAIDNNIQEKVETTNHQVDSALTQAELAAQDKVSATEVEAAQKKREAENKDEGFWSSVASAISDFFESLKEGLNALFDALRAEVQQLIEQAKSVVNTLIDFARKAIVGLIRAFGELLNGLISKALAAFPEIAARITGYIDAAIEGAVTGVNALAESLKNAVNTILDALGTILNAILSAYQAVFNAVLTALQLLADGRILEILNGIANLARGFAAMLTKIKTALIEEFVGTDVTEPLPNVERTDREIAQHETTLTAGQMMYVVSANNASGFGLPIALPDLASVSILSDNQVGIDDMLEMDPMLINSLSLSDGGQMDIGGSPDPVTTAQLQESAFGTGEHNAEWDETAGGAIGQLEGINAERNGEAPIPDFANMSDAQKLDQHIIEMNKSIGQPSTADAKDPEPVVNDPGVPYIAKTGRLGVGTRLNFIGRQMLTGMEKWWVQNQAAIYTAMVGILLVGGVVTFFTGGAGLIALLQLLMQVMTVYFVADAVLRIRSHLGDFFTKSWDGQTAEGGASLAKAIAVVTSEFFFEYILKGVGRALKKIRASVVATRRGAAVVRGTDRVAGGVGKGARAIGRTARRGARAVGSGARRMSNGARRAVVRGGRFVLSGFRKGTLRGARSLREVKRRILEIFAFRRIWVERHGRRLELWGEFNAKILLSTSTGELIEIDAAGRPIGRVKEMFKNITGRKKKSDHGSYTHTFESGKKYAGKGSPERAAKSAKDTTAKYEHNGKPDELVSTDWTPAEDIDQEFFDEALRIHEIGGVKSDANYNIKNTGTKVDRELLDFYIDYILSNKK